MIQPRSHIAGMAPYALADLSVAPGKTLISLAQNESWAAPSPLAIEAARRALTGAALYPDPDWRDLCEAIAETHDLSPGQILCGVGSMDLIATLFATYAGPGDEVLSTAHSYAFFQTAACMAGAGYVAAPETALTVDVEAVLGALTPRTRIVAIANPGNPTGTRIDRAAILDLRARLPGEVLLLIDEAYGEYADAPGEALFDLVARGDTVLLRTFSKAYGLAGLRAGWGVFPPAIRAEMRKCLAPNNLAAPVQAAAAAAMRDQAHMRQVVAETAVRRRQFQAAITSLGLTCHAGPTNFVLIAFPSAEEAAAADEALRAQGILMRGMAGYGLPHCLRATIGSEAAMAAAAQGLSQWMREDEQ